VRAESRLDVRREVGRDDADQERSQNRLAAIQRLSLNRTRWLSLNDALMPSAIAAHLVGRAQLSHNGGVLVLSMPPRTCPVEIFSSRSRTSLLGLK
jgi:hypothetical protein